MENQNSLKERAEKAFPPSVDIDYHLEVLFSFPEDQWFAPTNSVNEAYSICSVLAGEHLICRRITPSWHNGIFRGLQIEFRYKKDLNY